MRKLAAAVKLAVDAVTTSIETVGQPVISVLRRPIRHPIQSVVDPSTPAVKTFVYSVTPTVKPIIDAVPSTVKAIFELLAAIPWLSECREHEKH